MAALEENLARREHDGGMNNNEGGKSNKEPMEE